MKGMVAGFLAPRVHASAQMPIPPLTSLGSYKAWDAHSHLGQIPGDTPEERIDNLITHMDRLGIARVILSQGFGQFEYHPAPEQVRVENDRVMRAVRHRPERAYGSLYVSPDNPDFCLQEFDRCVRNGPMVCVGELETDVRCNSTVLDPLIERATAMQVPILQHSWLNANGNGAGESTPYDVVELARRHPHAKIICGHTGGNWEIGIPIIRDFPNIYAGIAGSDPTAGFTEMAVRELGAERVIYGSDVGGRCFGSQLAKVLGADIPSAAKELILGGNMRRLLEPVLKAKGLSA